MDEVEKQLALAANDTLEGLKKDGAADDDLEFTAATYDTIPSEKGRVPRYDCSISFKRASGDDSFLQVRFTMSPGADVYEMAAHHIRKQLKEHKWING